jgi:uncharacterized membrane protein YgdD (TMEM256/DUF423 family)
LFSNPQASFAFFSMAYRFPIFCAGIFGLTGVGLGACGAHGPLRVFLDQQGTFKNWEIAVHYQLVHTLALFCGAIWLHANGPHPRNKIIWATRWWTLGILFFCGSLYSLALGGPRFLGPITPLGGLALMLGWSCLILEALTSRQPLQF